MLLSVAAKAELPSAGTPSYGGYTDRRFAQELAHVPGLRAWRHSAAFATALYEAASQADVIHDHGLWLLPNLQAGWSAAAARKPFIISPRGMLGPPALAFSATKKRVCWKLLQGPVVRRATCLHATSDQEYNELRAFGLRHPIAVIPNGIDLLEGYQKRACDMLSDIGSKRVVLSLGRLHAKKGIERLLLAWAKIEPTHPDWCLSLIGPGERGYVSELRAMVQNLALRHVVFGDPVYGAAKWDAYRAADLFVLPSLNENFGLTIAEALATGTPTIATTGTPWSRLSTEGCGWWVEATPEALEAVLAAAMAMPRPVLREMGAKGRAWMMREFSWDRAAREMLRVYEWLIGCTGLPPSVRLA